MWIRSVCKRPWHSLKHFSSHILFLMKIFQLKDRDYCPLIFKCLYFRANTFGSLTLSLFFVLVSDWIGKIVQVSILGIHPLPRDAKDKRWSGHVGALKRNHQNAFVQGHQHGRYDVWWKPVISFKCIVSSNSSNLYCFIHWETVKKRLGWSSSGVRGSHPCDPDIEFTAHTYAGI